MQGGAELGREARARSTARLGIDALAPELHHKTQLALTEHGVDRPHDTGEAAEDDPVTDLERLLAGQVPGRDERGALAELVSVCKRSHRAANDTD